VAVGWDQVFIDTREFSGFVRSPYTGESKENACVFRTLERDAESTSARRGNWLDFGAQRCFSQKALETWPDCFPTLCILCGQRGANSVVLQRRSEDRIRNWYGMCGGEEGRVD